MTQRARRGFAPRDQTIPFSPLLSRQRHTGALVHAPLLTSRDRRLAPINPHRKRDRALVAAFDLPTYMRVLKDAVAEEAVREASDA